MRYWAENMCHVARIGKLWTDCRGKEACGEIMCSACVSQFSFNCKIIPITGSKPAALPMISRVSSSLLRAEEAQPRSGPIQLQPAAHNKHMQQHPPAQLSTVSPSTKGRKRMSAARTHRPFIKHQHRQDGQRQSLSASVVVKTRPPADEKKKETRGREESDLTHV